MTEIQDARERRDARVDWALVLGWLALAGGLVTFWVVVINGLARLAGVR
jgi:hypothetical protein